MIIVCPEPTVRGADSSMNDLNESSAVTERLARKLGLFDGTMMMIWIVLGSGIFLITGIIAEALPSPGLMLLAWLVGGLLTLCGAIAVFYFWRTVSSMKWNSDSNISH